MTTDTSQHDDDIPASMKRIVKRCREADAALDKAYSENQRGYAHSLITGTLFPVSSLPKGKNSYTVVRRGDASYSLVAGTDTKTNEVMMPYGLYPRLIMCWIAEQIRRASHGATDTCDPETQTITIPTVGRMMRELRINPGGRTRRNFVTQLYSLLTSSILVVKDVGGKDNPHEVHVPTRIANTAILPRPENVNSFAHCSFTLNPYIYDALADKSMPYVKAVLEYVVSHGGSVMKFDLFLWLSDTAPNLHFRLPVSWDELQQRFGRNYSGPREFHKDFRKAIKDISLIYPNLKYEIDSFGITIHPSPPQIRRNGTLNLDSTKD